MNLEMEVGAVNGNCDSLFWFQESTFSFVTTLSKSVTSNSDASKTNRFSFCIDYYAKHFQQIIA
jgi:hypothetical protein